MRTWTMTLALVLVSSVAQAAPTFEDCDSAHNYGYNTAWQLTSSVMNKAACADLSVKKGELALARQARKQKIPPANPLEHKVCFYAGFYAGYVDALVVEREQCGDDLPIASVAKAAAAVFTAMHDALLPVGDAMVDAIFDDVFPAGNPDPDDCDEVIYDEVLDLEAGLDELVESVCHDD